MRSRLFAVLLSLSVSALAAPKKPVAAVPAVPAQPASPSGKPATPTTLINSDLGGREMAFLAQAIDLGKALRYLASQTPRTANPALRGFGDDLVKTLAAQSVVLNTLAEMRKIPVGDGASASEQTLAGKISKLEGTKLEKAILDGFMDVDRRVILAYELGAKSEDLTIRKFVEQTLPQARKHLVLVESMAGIAPSRTVTEATSPPTPEPVDPPALPEAPTVTTNLPEPSVLPDSKHKPTFRTNIKLPGNGSVSPAR